MLERPAVPAVIPARARRNDRWLLSSPSTARPARIKVIGSHGYGALWIDNGCFHVSVRLTPDTARALAEQLLAQGSPVRGPSVAAGPTRGNALSPDDAAAAIDVRGGSRWCGASSLAGIDV